PPIVAIPDVRGMDQATATSTLEGAGFVVNVITANDPNVPEGEAIGTDPGVGREREQGSTVNLVMSDGPGTVAVPQVAGMSEADARAELQAAGFDVAREEREDAAAAGTVI